MISCGNRQHAAVAYVLGTLQLGNNATITNNQASGTTRGTCRQRQRSASAAAGNGAAVAMYSVNGTGTERPQQLHEHDHRSRREVYWFGGTGAA